LLLNPLVHFLSLLFHQHCIHMDLMHDLVGHCGMRIFKALHHAHDHGTLLWPTLFLKLMESCNTCMVASNTLIPFFLYPLFP
jgi:hypothetical protein